MHRNTMRRKGREGRGDTEEKGVDQIRGEGGMNRNTRRRESSCKRRGISWEGRREREGLHTQSERETE